MVGLLTLALGIIISNTAQINFQEDDWKDRRDEEDMAGMQYLIGAIFINFGVGIIIISLLIGLIANETINTKARIMLLLITTMIFYLWIYFAILSGILSKLTWIHP